MFCAICVQKTWLRHDLDTSLFDIPLYNLIHKGKIWSEHGRLIIYLKEELTYNYRKLYNQYNIFIDVCKEHMNKKLQQEIFIDHQIPTIRTPPLKILC